MECKLYIVRVFVRDFERALAFYTETLGIPAAFSDAGMGWAQLDTGVAQLALERVATEDHRPYEDAVGEDEELVGRFVGVSLTVDGVARTYEELTKRGVDFVSPPAKQPWGGVLAHFRDPDGNVLTLLGTPS
jgi:catechol 2,3-dioxygenase-like lactoylglutathione lyase family enzyme